MRFTNLTEQEIDIIHKTYNDSDTRLKAQEELSEYFNVSERTIRRWANALNLGVMKENLINPSKIMIYDIETSRAEAKVWWTGKQYVSHKQIIKEPSIITIAYKWLGEDEVTTLTWDNNHSDETMVAEFVKQYNKADMVVGFNNDNFDNRWVNARAMKYNLEINTFVRSLDLYKQEKRLFRMLGYSMDYSSLFAKVERKKSHEGILMWDMIEDGSSEEQLEYLQKMLDYNIGDIITTEELYIRLIPYLRHKIHVGVLNGEGKWTCPNTGSKNVSLWKTTITPSGTVQRIMKSHDGSKYKITNKTYMNFLDFKMKNNVIR